MRDKNNVPDAIEQYELSGPPMHRFGMDRRRFFKILGSGIAVTFVASHVLGREITGLADMEGDEASIRAWIHIGESNRITVYTGKVEVGQNIRTSLAQIVAEELRAPFSAIEMIMGDTDLTPYDRGTFGSRSIPYMGPQLRKAAASARELLIEMAAKQWGIDPAVLKVDNGTIHNPKTGKSFTFGELTKGKALLSDINDAVKVSSSDQWKVCGKAIGKVDGEKFVTGAHQYVSDMRIPRMMHGKVLRPPSYGAKLKSLDVSKAEAMPGVVCVHDGDFVAVCAEDIHKAEKALTMIRSEWDVQPQQSRQGIFNFLVSNGNNDRNPHVVGSIDNGWSNARAKIEQRFHVDYIAHAPLEPRAAVAKWEGDRITVWTGTQRPFGVQEELSEAFHMPKEKVRVIMPDTGSGYGGKHTGDAALEAARLSRSAGRPVKLVWTREEEFTWAYFRPAGVIKVKAAADNNGRVTAWEFHNYNSGGSGIETPYEVDNQSIHFHPVESPLRQGSYRGLAATANVFARESIMDDLARELQMDPLSFRLKNLRNDRLIAVLKAAAGSFGWGRSSAQKNHGFGLACGTEKGSYVATCAEVYVDPSSGNVNVTRAVTAFECGAIVNPEHLKNQILGAVVQGLGGALFEWIDFRDGKILNPMFSRYRVPRFSDLPRLEAVMVNRTDLPSAGAGETPIFGIAPAIRNAIVDACGKRLYTLPLAPDGLKVQGS